MREHGETNLTRRRTYRYNKDGLLGETGDIDGNPGGHEVFVFSHRGWGSRVSAASWLSTAVSHRVN